MVWNKSSKKRKPSEDVIRSLPDDIMTYEIVSRLPPKEICYFKTCSRKWNETLSDPSFKNQYREKSNKNSLKVFSVKFTHVGDRVTGENFEEFINLSLLDFEEGTIHYEDITKIDEDNPMKMLYAPNGNLTCFVSNKEFFIFNPTSKRFADLPKISFTTFHDFNQPGFGYVPSRNEYIFVHIFDVGQDDDFDMRCEWLTLSEADQEKDISSLSWKILETPCPYPVTINGVLIDGLFYFVISDQCDHSSKEIILSVDLEKESYKIIGHPDEKLYDEENLRVLVDLNGKLCFGDIFDGPLMIDLWILTDAENTEWMKLCRVDLRKLEGVTGEDKICINLLGLKNGELIFQNLAKDRLDFYNIEEGTSREGTANVPKQSQLCLYTQSLSFLNFGES